MSRALREFKEFREFSDGAKLSFLFSGVRDKREERVFHVRVVQKWR